MPCFDPQAAADDRHNGHLASAVCELFKSMSDDEVRALVARSPAMQRWWAEHQLRDTDYGAYMDKMFGERKQERGY